MFGDSLLKKQDAEKAQAENTAKIQKEVFEFETSWTGRGLPEDEAGVQLRGMVSMGCVALRQRGVEKDIILEYAGAIMDKAEEMAVAATEQQEQEQEQEQQTG